MVDDEVTKICDGMYMVQHQDDLTWSVASDQDMCNMDSTRRVQDAIAHKQQRRVTFDLDSTHWRDHKTQDFSVYDDE